MKTAQKGSLARITDTDVNGSQGLVARKTVGKIVEYVNGRVLPNQLLIQQVLHAEETTWILCGRKIWNPVNIKNGRWSEEPKLLVTTRK